MKRENWRPRKHFGTTYGAPKDRLEARNICKLGEKVPLINSVYVKKCYRLRLPSQSRVCAYSRAPRVWFPHLGQRFPLVPMGSVPRVWRSRYLAMGWVRSVLGRRHVKGREQPPKSRDPRAFGSLGMLPPPIVGGRFPAGGPGTALALTPGFKGALSFSPFPDSVFYQQLRDGMCRLS